MSHAPQTAPFPITAAVLREARQPFILEQLSLDGPRHDEVLVEIQAAGICHTDLLAQAGALGTPLPMVLGHEGVGRVVAVGEKVTDLGAGDLVVLSFASCGDCAFCRRDHPAYCDEFRSLNFGGARPDGSVTLRDSDHRPVYGNFFGQSSFASHSLVRRRNAIKVATTCRYEELAPLGCGIQTGAGTILNVLKPDRSDVVAIVGAGGVGLAALMAARAMGCDEIVAIDRSASRLALARALGARYTINSGERDIQTELSNLPPISCAIDTTGVPSLMEAILNRLAKRGSLALVAANSSSQISLNARDLLSGKMIRGITEGDADPQVFIPRLVELVENGKLPISKIVGRYDLNSINTAIADMENGSTVKAVLMI